jgi:histone-arginine methyltransferase CARM1
VCQCRIEDLDDECLEHNVDVLISEPLGVMLFHERMLETYIIARDRFLKPGGKMFPSEAQLSVAPFSDEKLLRAQLRKTEFWSTNNYFGFDLSVLRAQAIEEKLRQPVIELYDPSTQ